LAYSCYGVITAAFVGGAFAVMVLRDIGWYRRTVANWPVLQQVIDWSKVEQLSSLDKPGNV
jgi:hypothetical protein